MSHGSFIFGKNYSASTVYLFLISCISNQLHSGIGHIPGLVINEFIRVLVLDQRTIAIMRETMAKDDYVILEGRIQYQPYEVADGKKNQGGYILASKIQRFVS